MRNLLILLALTLAALTGTAQTDTIKGTTFQLKGTIAGEVFLPAHCGIFAMALVVEFGDIAFSDPAYKADQIAVIFSCPEFYGEGFFEKGKTYTMTLADENPAEFGWMITNGHLLKKYPLPKDLWVIEAKKIN